MDIRIWCTIMAVCGTFKHHNHDHVLQLGGTFIPNNVPSSLLNGAKYSRMACSRSGVNCRRVQVWRVGNGGQRGRSARSKSGNWCDIETRNTESSVGSKRNGLKANITSRVSHIMTTAKDRLSAGAGFLRVVPYRYFTVDLEIEDDCFSLKMKCLSCHQVSLSTNVETQETERPNICFFLVAIKRAYLGWIWIRQPKDNAKTREKQKNRYTLHMLFSFCPYMATNNQI